ncbi:alpha/beta hydrolase [Bacillus carboniphilus]|uniref:Alpha/beta hydrolase n=1 Tax=Bacillus carboniphilus TaxID=86663 RepID=A0ABY9JTP6_9BACI|nr:alpha/beta hydrolase [Bacillus carboniphilus]WLR42194.1 alpha/beta hydrolase [Bacillus carboniphilus]
MFKEINIHYGAHESQYGVLRIPENSQSSQLIVLIHGGFWKAQYNLEENTAMAEDLTKRGFTTWNIEYRRVGEDRKGWTDLFNDVIDAVNHLSKIEESYPIDISNVTVIGHSAGGHLALWLGSRNEKSTNDGTFHELRVCINKVISLAGVTDLVKMWEFHEQKKMESRVAPLLGGSPKEVPERYAWASPIERLPMGVEQVLIHGEQDRHVPVELSDNYYQRAMEKGDKVSLVVLSEIEHFKVIDPTSSAWNSVIESI